MIERSLKGEAFSIEEVPLDARPSFERFLEYKTLQPFEIIKTEAVLHHKVFKYAGTMDALARFPDGRIILLDWKTSKGLWPEYHLQVIAYKEAAEEMTGEKIDDVEIVRFGKEGNPFNPKTDRYIVPREKHDYLFNTFAHALELWKWQSKKG
jgi:ATP-dependent exoDNAse (exonuclease V) beta subunit